MLQSIAAGTAGVVDDLTAVTGEAPRRLALVGGGARVGLLRDLLAERTGLEVIAGSTEATALGNAVVQGIALGRFDGLPAARTVAGAHRKAGHERTNGPAEAVSWLTACSTAPRSASPRSAT